MFSGIQPTGAKHLGNYLGAVKPFCRLQTPDSLFMIADLHAMTVQFDPKVLRQKTLDTAAFLLACGVENVFRQSDVAFHTELSVLLSNVASFGDLTRMHQFQTKAQAQRELVSVGLFAYPVLQAADILLYKPKEVLVGEDQKQHINLTRTIAKDFQRRFGSALEVPKASEISIKIQDLQDPSIKMSTSNPNHSGVVLMSDSKKQTEQKFKRAQTDALASIKYTDLQPGVSNLIEILALVRGQTIEQTEQSFDHNQYGQLKQEVARAVCDELEPIRAKSLEIAKDPDYVLAKLKATKQKAIAVAEPNMQAVRNALGIGS